MPPTVDSKHEPVFETGALNGRPAIRFDGASDGLDFSNSTSQGAVIEDTLAFDMFFVIRINTAIANTYFLNSIDSSSNRGFMAYVDANSKIGFLIGKGDGTVHANKVTTAALTLGRWHLIEVTGDAANYKFSVDGGAFTDSTAFTQTLTTGYQNHNARIGGNVVANHGSDVAIGAEIVYPKQLSSGDRTLTRNTLTAKWGSLPTSLPAKFLEAIGDSITLGQNVDIPWPLKLELQLGPTNISVANYGFSGDLTSGMLTRWTSSGRGIGETHLAILGCVNDLKNAADDTTSQATAEAGCESNLGTIISQAVSDGVEVCLSTMTPWRGYSGSSTNRQASTQTFNTWARAQAATHVHIYDAAIDSGLGDGTLSTPGTLGAGVSIGDGLHPNQAGADIQLAGVRTCFGF